MISVEKNYKVQIILQNNVRILSNGTSMKRHVRTTVEVYN